MKSWEEFILYVFIAVTGLSAATLLYLTCRAFIKHRTMVSKLALVNIYVTLNVTMLTAVPMGIFFIICEESECSRYGLSYILRTTFAGINYTAFRLSFYAILIRVQSLFVKSGYYRLALKFLLYATWIILVLDLIEALLYLALINLGQFSAFFEAYHSCFTILLTCPAILLIATFIVCNLIWQRRYKQCICTRDKMLALTFFTLIFQQIVLVVMLWIKSNLQSSVETYWIDFYRYLTMVLIQVPSTYVMFAIIVQEERSRGMDHAQMIINLNNSDTE
eukprot:TRINITY_DN3648_c0_g1_i1.p1 TRINITY_DN3648_c0_g1~~TRINITY_DN3648_c0_g1_i1.p1  ORF type:complete len:277 (+),score=-9.75 TRINITY_DN3648_c0_g1_i1:153-983(+)